MDCSPPSSSVHGIFQAILEWLPISSSKGSSQPRDPNPTPTPQLLPNSCVSWIGRQILHLFATWETLSGLISYVLVSNDGFTTTSVKYQVLPHPCPPSPPSSSRSIPCIYLLCLFITCLLLLKCELHKGRAFYLVLCATVLVLKYIMNHSKTEFLQIRVFIYFLMISMGMEFVRGLAWWFWLRVFHEIQLDADRGCRHLRAWLRLEGFLAKQLTYLQAGAGCCQFSPNPLLNFPAWLLEGPLLWKQGSPDWMIQEMKGETAISLMP